MTTSPLTQSLTGVAVEFGLLAKSTAVRWFSHRELQQKQPGCSEWWNQLESQTQPTIPRNAIMSNQSATQRRRRMT